MDAEPRWLTPDRIGIRLSLVSFGVPRALALWLATASAAPALVERPREPLSARFLAEMPSQDHF